jgi:hypothetical protein
MSERRATVQENRTTTRRSDEAADFRRRALVEQLVSRNVPEQEIVRALRGMK